MRLYLSGIKTITQGKKAVSLGADAVGIRIGYGQNEVDPEKAREIYFSLPIFISRVGIFSNQKIYEIQELITFCRLDTLHFDGDEKPEEIKRYPEHTLKTFTSSSLDEINFFDLAGIVLELQKDDLAGVQIKEFEHLSLILRGNLTDQEWDISINKYKPFGVNWDLGNYPNKILEDYFGKVN